MTDKKISVSHFKDQQYDALKKAAVSSGNLFVDPEFPAEPQSLVQKMRPLPNFGWKRPGEICQDPHLFVDGAEAADIHQGIVGNCWFVDACSCLALYKDILYEVVPDHKEQEWDPQNPSSYGGIFRFHIWHYGKWMEVVVDDLLPLFNDELLFTHSRSKNEFWSALLEKAYAKLFGSYEALDGGKLGGTLVDFTGGVAETYKLQIMDLFPKENREEFFERLQTDMECKSLMAASIPPYSEDELEDVTEVGLVLGHAYGITAVRALPLAGTGSREHFHTDELHMIRLRNPWRKCEWNGAFSVGSPEWDKIGKTELDYENDGEFWMTLEDFVKHFLLVTVCRVVNAYFFSLPKTWYEAVDHGEWKPGLAGGCWNHRDTCLMNPQYLFNIDMDEDEIMVELTQKSTHTAATWLTYESIGFVIVRCELNRKSRVHNPACFTKMTAVSFSNSRSVFQRVRLVKGKYVLVPSTFDPGKRLQYLLRVYTSSPNDFKPMMEEEQELVKMGCCCPKATPPKLVTQVKVMSVEGLESQDFIGNPDLYCVVLCENQKETTQSVPHEFSPTWDTWFLFFRWYPDKPITIQLWNHNAPEDQHMGEYTMSFSSNCNPNCWDCPLHHQTDAKKLVPGNLKLHVTQSDRLDGI